MMIDKSKLYLEKIDLDYNSITYLFRLLDIDFPVTNRIPLFMLRSSLKKKTLNS